MAGPRATQELLALRIVLWRHIAAAAAHLIPAPVLCAVLCRAATPPLQMGLGKTAQSISVLAFQKQYGGCRGPFLGECRQQAA